MNFAKIFPVTKYDQIVMIKKQDDAGAPEIKFFFKPEGYGVCSFSIGFDDDAAEKRVEDAFENIFKKDAIEIVDAWLKKMRESQESTMN